MLSSHIKADLTLEIRTQWSVDFHVLEILYGFNSPLKSLFPDSKAEKVNVLQKKKELLELSTVHNRRGIDKLGIFSEAFLSPAKKKFFS